MKVEEGTPQGGVNRPSADAEAELRAYFVRKRTTARGASLVLAGASALVALWSPVSGFVLAVGGACGIANMFLIMRNNERLLDGNRSRAVFAAGNMVRILAVAAIPVIIVMHEPWWAMGIYFAGFFTPLAWYAVETQRWIQRGT